MKNLKLISFFLWIIGFVCLANAQNMIQNYDTPNSADTLNQEICADCKQEILLRDSLMAISDSACSVEKDSLRSALNSEQAKCENWEKSYDTMKKSNETCAQALSISIGVNENYKNKEKDDRKAAAAMTSTSFIGGVGIGLLIMWLIMR